LTAAAPGSPSRARDRALLAWLAAGVVGFALVPWYMQQPSTLSLAWLPAFSTRDSAPALLQAAAHGRVWLWPVGALLAAIGVLCARGPLQHGRANAVAVLATLGLAWLVLQGLAIGPRGAKGALLTTLAGDGRSGQPGIGVGGALVACAFTMLAAVALARSGRFRGDGFIAGGVIGIAVLLAVFTFYPVLSILASAVQDGAGAASLSAFVHRLATEKIWGIGCVAASTRCGVAWNTLALALACASACTLLGLAFALVVARTTSRLRRPLRLPSVLPIITPPFVIGLGLILLFGRAGLVNRLLEFAFGIEPTRWIYGFQGVLLAQVFAFTPIAFLVLVGVVEGVAPSLEEAAQTLRADRRATFFTVSLPLMRPGLANAFLISFIESIADFGNPILLGGNFGVLSTEIFFSVVGAQLDQGRAATLGVILLGFALSAFLLQRRVLGRRVYTAMGGKGDAGTPSKLPDGVRVACHALASAWALLTLVIYAMALAGGFVENWGRDYTPTLRHYVRAFGVEWGPRGVIWTGSAWNSFWTTVELSAVAAPITAALGLLAAYLIARQRFFGHAAFEFGTLLSFAIPGTVIGVAYILAFNVPPLEITGTAAILVACNVFRNMPVGVRAGIASIAQIDRSLDEAASTLGARGFTTFRTVVMPLMKPAIVAALVYSFVRAMTTLSAVIFLVSAEYEWATTYIINRVINGDYGVAIAYCSVLIVLMVAAILVIQRVVGVRQLGRRPAEPRATVVLGGTAA
jgi:iron(III) transport system permease protein